MSRGSKPGPETVERLPDAERRSRRAAEVLQELSERGGFKSIPAPVAWQKEIREDRPFSGGINDHDEQQLPESRLSS